MLQIAQVVLKLDLSKPLLVVLRDKEKKKLKGLALIPGDDGKEAKLWLKQACKGLETYKVDKFKGKGLDAFHMFTSNNLDGADSVLSNALEYQR